MGLFRRREPLHERLAREAGLVDAPADARAAARVAGDGDPRHAPPARVGRDGHRRRARRRRQTRSGSSRCPTARCSSRKAPTSSLEPLAAAVEQAVRPPYRAAGHAPGRDASGRSRRGSIEVIELPDGPRATRSTSRTPRTARRSPSTTPASSARCRRSRARRRGRAASTPSTPSGSTATSGKCAPRRSDMGIFRRRREETLNEQMLHEAGLDDDRSTQPEAEPECAEPGRSVRRDVSRRPTRSGSGHARWRAPASTTPSSTVHAPDIAGDTRRVRDAPERRRDRGHRAGRRGSLAARRRGREAARAAVPRRRAARRRRHSGRSPPAAIDVLGSHFAGGDEIELASDRRRRST